MKLNALQAGFNLDHIALESPEPDRLANFYKDFIMMEYKEQKKEELIMQGLIQNNLNLIFINHPLEI